MTAKHFQCITFQKKFVQYVKMITFACVSDLNNSKLEFSSLKKTIHKQLKGDRKYEEEIQMPRVRIRI